MSEPTTSTTIYGRLSTLAEERPEQDFLISRDFAVTRNGMVERALLVAGALARSGVGPGERVVVFADNRQEHLDLLFGSNVIGAVYCPIHPDLRGRSLNDVLDLLEPSLVVVDSSERAARLPDELARIVVSIEQGSQDHVPYSSWISTAPYEGTPTADPSSTALILMTSGTTGRAKGVEIGNRFALEVGEANVRSRAITSEDRLHTCFSFCHTNAHCFTLLPALCAGAAMVWGPKFSVSGFWAEIKDLRATQFSMFHSTMLMMLGAQPAQSDREHGALVCLSIGTPQGRGEEFESRFGIEIVEPYGMTESGIMTVQNASSKRLGSIGRSVPEWEVRVVDPDGNDVPVGTPGEIVGRPRRPGLLMSGYFRNPAATLDAFKDLWFHTGDRGWVDADGYLWYGGRAQDVIRRRGENIAATDIEHIARMSGLVRDAAAIPVPSPLGEDDVLLVVEGLTGGPQDLFDALKNDLARYALPQYIKSVEELPRTPSGRVTKAILRDAGVDSTTWTKPKERVRT